jgi:CRISPR system Cascade subunit CasE
MIASILSLDRNAMKQYRVTDPYSIHRVVYSLFPKTEDTRDFLFADKGGSFNERNILIFSKREPLQPEYGAIESKTIPDSFLQQACYGFTVRLNATKREKESGKIRAITGKENLVEWFCTKCETWGFSTVREKLEIVDAGLQNFEKSNNDVTQNSAVFKGVLKVTDRDLFIKSFEEGIGRGKAFGFGLLEIIPLAVEE